MNAQELIRANALCVRQAITITLYTGTSNAKLASDFLAQFCFDTQVNFRDTYVIQKLGSRQQRFKANYGPGIYLTDNVDEAKTYGTTTVKFVCTQTPFADVAGRGAKLFRDTAQIKGGPQAVLEEPNLAALLLVAAGGTNYYVLRTPTGVVPGTYP
jgi:hypothetical protein